MYSGVTAIRVGGTQMETMVVEQALADYDAEVAEARERLNQRLFGHATAAPRTVVPVEGDWEFIEERTGERYPWPTGVDNYDQFWVYRAPDGRLFGVGKVTEGYDGRDFWMTFYLGAGGGSKRPVVMFVAADDYATTSDTAAIIRGKGATGKAMFGMDEELPEIYADDRFDIQLYKSRVNPKSGYSYNKAGVIVKADDHVGMLRHAQAQVDLRGLYPESA